MLRVVSCWVLVIFCLQDSFSELEIKNLNIGTRNVKMTVNLACECGLVESARTKRIINGKSVDPHAYPWMVAIFANSTPNSANDILCGGSLINDRYVLTSGKCVEESTEEGIRLGIGMDLYSHPNESDIRKIKRIIRHPDYYSEPLEHSDALYPYHRYNDIALMELEEPVNILHLDHVRQVCLPFDMARNDFIGLSATIAGWGETAQQDGHRPDLLREATVKVISTGACEKDMEELLDDKVYIDYNELCTERAYICKFDKGGPLFTRIFGRYMQIGVISMGSVCRNFLPTHEPTIYSSVPEFMGWILEETQDAVYCS